MRVNVRVNACATSAVCGGAWVTNDERYLVTLAEEAQLAELVVIAQLLPLRSSIDIMYVCCTHTRASVMHDDRQQQHSDSSCLHDGCRVSVGKPIQVRTLLLPNALQHI
eukprot:COSAG01_NODE_11100_length_2008_cov_2.870613_3_plen_109_part_00